MRKDSLLLKLNLDTIHPFDRSLRPQKFVRVHRSFVINLTKITNIDPNNLEVNKKIIPISSTYKDELLNRITVL